MVFSIPQLSKIQVQFSRGFASGQFLSINTCIGLLQSCAQAQELSKGRELHGRMLRSGHLDSPLSATSLINMYTKCNSVPDAVSVFNSTLDVHNVFVYNSIIAGLASNRFPGQAFQYFLRMRSTGIPPDKFTFPCVIKACPSIPDLKKIHSLLLKLELNLDVFVGSALVHSYIKFELTNDALQVFDNMPVRDDIVLWNAMINGYVQIGAFVKALKIFRQMAGTRLVPDQYTVTGAFSALALAGDISNGKLLHSFAVKMGFESCVAVLNALIDMYGKCRHLSDARMVFENTAYKDMYSWNSILSVHEQCGDHDETLKLLKQMIKVGFPPDLVTVAAAIPACSHLSALMHGRQIHGYMIANGLDTGGNNTFIENTIMDMYTKCGSLREARLVFNRMMVKHIASWNIMITGYGMHGLGNEALDLFSRMCNSGFKPDVSSFVGFLSACSHSGFVNKGQQLLAEMQPKYGVAPAIEHYACVIDMLGRAGKLEESLGLISSMPIKPNQVVWRSFLAACRLHGNATLAEIAAQRAVEIDPENCGNYVLMSNVYGAAGRYQEVVETRQVMQQYVKKLPGCSWIELGDGMHMFYNGDRNHPKENLLYDGLDSLTACLSEHTYALDVVESIPI